jgi:rhomboid protease GluP
MCLKRIKYNSPVVLTFAALSLLSLLFGAVSGGTTTLKFFCVYRAPLSDPLTYLRFFTHVLGHSSYSHYINNMLLLLVIGPQIEEKYGSRALLEAVLATAFVSGMVQFLFFPSNAVLGASGIVYMMIIMSSFTGFKKGTIPLTMIIVFVLYIGGEIVTGVALSDNISQLTHIIGGVCGGVFGYMLTAGGRARRR